uniref:Acetylserotonin O-methyltransferase n=1 Tax=Laticauda laticaudata TaxID=8630 RepID=A0A8C5S3M9_LATLA
MVKALCLLQCFHVLKLISVNKSPSQFTKLSSDYILSYMESGEPLSSTTVAERLSTSPIGMQRLLDACVGLNLLTLDWKDGKGNPHLQYANTNLVNNINTCLSRKSITIYKYTFTTKCRFFKILISIIQVIFVKMTTTITSFYKVILRDVYFNSRSKEELQTFSNFMNDVWPLLGREVLSAFDLSQFPLICDLGGKYRQCFVIFFTSSKNHCLPSEESRITFHSGDFFEDPFPEADLYILARILHDWSDERCSQLQHKVYQACKPGGGVLIVEMLLNEDRRGPLAAHIYSFLMLLSTEGREWSVSLMPSSAKLVYKKLN